MDFDDFEDFEDMNKEEFFEWLYDNREYLADLFFVEVSEDDEFMLEGNIKYTANPFGAKKQIYAEVVGSWLCFTQ